MRKMIVGVPVDWLTMEEVIRKIAGFILTGKPHQITTVNPEFIVESRHNNDFRSVLQGADLSLPDGIGIVFAQELNENNPSHSVLVRILSYLAIGIRYMFAPHTLSYQRITGVSLTEAILTRAAKEGWKVFFLGAKPGVAVRAARVWLSRHPALRIVGTSSHNPDNSELIPDITRTKPDVLLVAYGAPKQDLFISRHKIELSVPVMIGVGGTFDYVAGEVAQAPPFLRSMGLEWLVRLIRQPRRWRRIWNATVVFSAMVIKN